MYIGRKRLARHKQLHKVETLKSLSQVRAVGVVYDAKKTSPQLLQKVIHYFEAIGTKVVTLGFVDDKNQTGFERSEMKDFFCAKDLNFWKLPKKQTVSHFVVQDFDYLINFDMEGRNELQAISTYSVAKTRIGKFFENYPFGQDFMVKSCAKTHEELFIDIKKYLK